MELMQKVEDEEKPKTPIDRGILERLEKAREFYRTMLKEINAQR